VVDKKENPGDEKIEADDRPDDFGFEGVFRLGRRFLLVGHGEGVRERPNTLARSPAGKKAKRASPNGTPLV
jgi:hypothetical protein